MKKNFSIFSFKIFKTPLIIIMIFLVVEVVFRLNFFGISGVKNILNCSPQTLIFSNIIEASTDPELSWKLIPNLDTFYKCSVFKTNSFGFRDREFKKEKNKSRLRIAVLGRSISMGAGVLQKDNWPSQLQLLLDKNSKDIEILNFSVAGYNINQVIKNYKINVKNFKPDVIILPFLLPEWGLSLSKSPQKLNSNLLKKMTNLQRYYGHFFLYHATRTFIKTNTNKFLSTDWLAKANLYKTQKLKTTFSKSLIKFIEEIKGSQTKIILVSVPRPGSEFTHYSDYVRKKISNIVSQHAHVDIIHADQKSQRKFNMKDVIYYGDSHPNERVHRELAEIIFKEIKR